MVKYYFVDYMTSLTSCFLVISFSLADSSYVVSEKPNAMIPVRIRKEESDVLLSSPVTLRLTPLKIDAALSRGVISEFATENPVSPTRAS